MYFSRFMKMTRMLLQATHSGLFSRLSLRLLQRNQTCFYSCVNRTSTADRVVKDVAVPDNADVVIIGGGVIGCSLLYHLSKYGAGNVVLLEKDQLTAGTTWHTAGLVWSLRPSDVEIELLKRSKSLMKSLQSETGVDTGWINNGGLFVAKTKVRFDEYKRLYTLGKIFGVESHILSPEESKQVHPLMNVSDIIGCLYSPTDGTIEPDGYCTALTRGATKWGGKVFQNCSVTGISTYTDDFGTKRVKSVQTTLGDIQTDVVVNACGVWAAKIGAMAGVSVPLVSMRHAYVLTEGIPDLRNILTKQTVPNIRDHDASLYCKLQGDALSVGGYEPNPVFISEVPADFSFSLYDLDWDVFSFNIEGAVNRVPAIERVGIKSTVCGPESFTPDHKPLLGESPEVRGFYLACGFNSAGMMFSIFAEELAKWIIQGRPELDMYKFDIRRFSTKYTSNTKWLKEGSHEAYAKNYAIVFPHDEPLASRNMRKDALYEVLLDAGCVYQQRQGWERPGWFTNDGPAPPLPYDYYGYYGHHKNETYQYYDKLKYDYTFDFPEHHDQIGSECLACRKSVVVFNMSYFGKFYLVGPDAQLAADWLFTNDMQKNSGSVVYTCMLNKYGGIELDLTVSIIESGSGQPHSPKFEGQGFYLAVGGGAAQHAYSYILDIIQDHKWKCTLLDHSEDLCLISVQGPKSRNVLQTLTECDLSDKAFPQATHKVIQIGDHEARVMRMSFVGELGFELHISSSAAVETYNNIMKAGKEYGIRNAGYRALDSLSLEKGYRLWPTDIRPDRNPIQSGLGFTCKLHKQTPFLGKEAVELAKDEGVREKLVLFTFDSQTKPLLGGEVIWHDDVPVGYIYRAEYSHTLAKSIAAAYISRPGGTIVNKDYLKQGSFKVEIMGDLVSNPQMIPYNPRLEFKDHVKGNSDDGKV